MIIDGDVVAKIDTESGGRYMSLKQHDDLIVIDKKQAAQLVAVFAKWIDGEEVK
ncbi:hypothetical protein JFM28_004693 [Salmonella enterica]|nr:hypothetical protein [Salmonella enterica]